MNEYICWAKEVLNNKYDVINISLIFNKSYSTMYKIETNKKSLYLKINNSLFNYEHKIIDYLYLLNPENNIEILFYNDELNCFITKEAGFPIIEKLNENYSEIIIEKTIIAYAQIQKNIDVNIIENIQIRKIPTYDLSNMFFNFLNQKQDYLNKNKINKLLKLKNKIDLTIEELLKTKIKDSIEHSDFHLGNILYNNNQEIIFIDWAEATLTNPFFSLLSYFNSLEKRFPLNININFKNNIKNKYLEVFKNKEINNINNSFILSEKLYPIYYILCLKELMKTDIKNKYWKEKLNCYLDKTILNFK